MLVKVVNGTIIRPNIRIGGLGDNSGFDWSSLSPEEQKAISNGRWKALGASLALAALSWVGFIYYATRADLNDSRNNNPPIVKPLDKPLVNK